MALWLQTAGQLYLPPSKPVARVLSTDEYVQPTNLVFHTGTDRMLIVGHPYFDIIDSGSNNITVPKCSGNQFRVMRLLFPDPNKFAMIDRAVFNPERERLVWRLEGLEIGRGGPLGIGTSGHPLFNKYGDTENPAAYPLKQNNGDDNRMDVSMDPKQMQLFIVGCKPATGEHWDIAKPCDPAPAKGSCPPIKLTQSIIQDGEMCDTGFGNANFITLQEDKSGVPLDITNEICKYPDLLKMTKDIYGDAVFFFGKREQIYSRHYFVRGGIDGDSLPDSGYYLAPQTDKPQNNLGGYSYFPTPSGSVASSDNQLFNRPYWLHRAQGANNGICWGNQLFITIVDNTRNTNLSISVYKQDAAIDNRYKYKQEDFRQYLRHTEEYEVELILRLCKVPLNPDVLAHLNVMDKNILEDWQLSFVPPPPQGIEDAYRYIMSQATMCPTDVPNTEREDPYKQYTFWTIDLQERFSNELSQFSLGKRYLYQYGLLNGRKRSASSFVTKKSKTVKRKRTK
ncbi:major capsid protein L1 [Human papillomavirus type 60]|uniref:Major capsid protein L1 n=1 Tax=Human papillomavirus type 60 TaxID=40540 RepID=VL1_HPV60|nr:major capsid protein L1 [Human papillomavirus type 60]P50821.2 RecName: Full=Major capsid protein L1 [Human papillomavirus type 60]AAA79491.1 major capsid protein L1 [Human papillomavirus type 60]